MPHGSPCRPEALPPTKCWHLLAAVRMTATLLKKNLEPYSSKTYSAKA